MANTGPLTKETFVDKFDILLNRFGTSNEYYDRATLSNRTSAFLSKLYFVIKNIDLEDLEQYLQLFKLQAKHENEDWSNNYRCKIISFIQNYDSNDYISLEEVSPELLLYSQPTQGLLYSIIFNSFQRQLLNLHLTDGHSINELAEFYHVDRSAIRRYLYQIYSILKFELLE